jgi:xylulokinase
MVMYGTTIFFIQVIPELHRDARHWSAPFLFPGTWAAMGGVSTGGALTHWFRDNILRMRDPEGAFGALAEEAAGSPPGANGLIVLPYFSGERTPINDPDARGMVFGLNLTHQRADLYRALLEGVGHATRHNLDLFDEVFPSRAIYAVGGGVNNPMWIQSSVDISGKAQAVRRHTIGAAMGSAFLAGIGVGALRAGDIGRINPVERHIRPQAHLKARYDHDHGIYLDLYRATRDLMAKVL